MGRQTCTGIGAIIVAAALAGVGGQVAGAEPLPTLLLHISDQTGVPAAVLKRAQEECTEVYRHIGVDVVWTDGQSTPEVTSARHIFVVIVPAERAGRMPVNPTALGVAVTSPTSRGRLVYVLYNRVETVARNADAAVATVLGHAIAHEIGHLLLPAGHTLSGLMAAEWDTNDLRQAEGGHLQFTPGQAAVIRARLVRAR